MYTLEVVYRKTEKDWRYRLPKSFDTCAPIEVGSMLMLTSGALWFRSTPVKEFVVDGDTHTVTTINGSIYKVTKI